MFLLHLIIGASITNGICSYALTIENTDYTIWYQGRAYKVNEPHNPVKVVSAVVNAENVSLILPLLLEFTSQAADRIKPGFLDQKI